MIVGGSDLSVGSVSSCIFAAAPHKIGLVVAAGVKPTLCPTAGIATDVEHSRVISAKLFVGTLGAARVFAVTHLLYISL